MPSISLIFAMILHPVLGFRSPMSSTKRIRTIFVDLRMRVDNFDALIFDCDGVIAETERDAHRLSFNEAFKDKGLTTSWDVDLYGELLKIGGGKERMTNHFNNIGWPTDVIDKQKFVQDLHILKTEKFEKVILSGVVPLRPGVMRLMDEAINQGVPIAICSTSNENAVKTIVRTLLGERISKIRIFAGDIVKNKKPSPDIYNLAAKELDVDPLRCWVIEDSEIGLKAAKSAGMRCVVTKSVYTKNELFDNADAIVEDLDRGLDGPISMSWLNYKASPKKVNIPAALENAEMFAATPNYAKMFTKIAKGDMF